MSPSPHRQRVENALEGAAEDPPVTGLSFVPGGALSGRDGQGISPGNNAALLAAAAGDLDVDFAFVPGDQPWAEDAVALLHESRRGVFWAVDGPLWPVLVALGPAEALKATAWDPDHLDDVLDAQLERASAQVLKGAALGADFIVIADDLAGSSGPLLPPDYFNDRLVPRYALLVATAASTGLRCVFHSDGDTRVFLAGLARAGFIGLHGGGGIGQEGFERLLGEGREHGLALLGGIDTMMLHEGETAAVRVGERAAALASAGGLLVTDDGGITSAEEIASLAAAFGAVGVDR